MPTLNHLSPGMPCWFELGTTNQEAAKQFYTQLFGWTVDDFPMGPSGSYSIFHKDGADTGAAYALRPDMLQEGIPPHWAVYFAVANVDESTQKVKQLNGQVIEPAFDVMTVGRMSVDKDPGNAVFCLWQEKRPNVALAFGEDNAVCWAELATWDTELARKFYTQLLGWETKGAASMATYFEFSVAGRPCGGILPMDENWKGIPSHWGIYFMAADCDALTEKAKSLGATVRNGPFAAPGVGRIAMLADPQGAGFSLITLERR
jgi:predicted enzyme related to lactoylglutathione lyase